MDVMRGRDGFYIVEAMVALGLLVFGFLGFVALLSNSLSLNRVATHAYIGNFLALEGIELVKNTVDANIMYRQNFGNDACEWNSGFMKQDPGDAEEFEIDWSLAPMSGSCPGDSIRSKPFFGGEGTPLRLDENGRYGYLGGEDTVFRRRVRVVTVPAPDGEESYELRVNSIVTWTTRGGAQFEVNTEDHLFNWQRR